MITSIIIGFIIWFWYGYFIGIYFQIETSEIHEYKITNVIINGPIWWVIYVVNKIKINKPCFEFLRPKKKD